MKRFLFCNVVPSTVCAVLAHYYHGDGLWVLVFVIANFWGYVEGRTIR